MRHMDSPKRPAEFYRSLPKVDLHRHLEGSLRFSTLRELARSQGLDLPATAELRSLVQVQPNQPFTFDNFLSKFATLRLFYRSGEIINRLTHEAIVDAAADHVRYLELRFTPVALSKAQDFSLAQVMDWVIAGARQGEAESGVITRLIASINRHESIELAAQVSLLAAERKDEGIIGLDLAGNEANFSAEPFAPIFRTARKNGLHITAHAGEWGPGSNVLQAIQQLEAERIGHGIRVLESAAAVRLASELGIPFEVCLTSNYQSGAVPQADAHPLMQMLSAGLNVTLNSDDPSISQITLGDEYRLACERYQLPLGELSRVILAGIKADFLPAIEKQRLLAEFEQELQARIFGLHQGDELA